MGSNRGVISLCKEEDDLPLKFSSGEATQIKELIGIALAMENLPILPRHIDRHLFQVQFNEDNTLTVLAPGREGQLTFTWLEGDEVIVRVEDGLKMALNDRLVGMEGKPPKYVGESGEPFV